MRTVAAHDRPDSMCISPNPADPEELRMHLLVNEMSH